MPTRLLSAALLALVIAFASAPVAAQGESGQTQQPGPTASFSERELRTFAVASLEVEEIAKRFEAQLAGIATAEEKLEVVEQANSEMASAVERKGFSVDRYNKMVETVTRDPNLARQVLDFRGETPQPTN